MKEIGEPTVKPMTEAGIFAPILLPANIAMRPADSREGAAFTAFSLTAELLTCV